MSGRVSGGRILGGIGRAFIVAGLLILGFVGYQLWGTNLETARNQDELTRSLASSTGGPETDDLGEVTQALARVDPATAPPTPAPPLGEALGVITISKIGLQAAVVEGVSRADLKKGPGHYPGTPLPGQAGNSGIAGHRTTYGAPFNRIDELAPGDEILVDTAQGRFRYEVRAAPAGAGQPDGQAWWAVRPDQTEVLDDTGENLLTLTVCHPKYSARQRIIVQAELASPLAVATVADPPVEQASGADELDDGFGGDRGAWPIAVAFLVSAAIVALLAWVVGRRNHRWLASLIAAPIVLGLVWGCYVYLDRSLPAL